MIIFAVFFLLLHLKHGWKKKTVRVIEKFQSRYESNRSIIINERVCVTTRFYRLSRFHRDTLRTRLLYTRTYTYVDRREAFIYGKTMFGLNASSTPFASVFGDTIRLMKQAVN